MRPLKISAISYLNTAPLLWDFTHGATPEHPGELPAALRRDFTLSYTVPSQCADALRTGTADIGIIPAIALASIPGLVILSDAAIAAKGTVRSILLISKVPIEDVETIATDTSSLTSVALTRILFDRVWGGVRHFRPMAPELDSMLRVCDAALLIGDSALRVRPMAAGKYHVYDLAEEWRKFTGRGFVFAFWAVRLKALDETRNDLDVAQVFRASRDHGIQPEHLDAIARNWTPRTGISEAEIVSYLKQNIRYALDADSLGGLDLFYRYAAECGVIEAMPTLRFLGLPACEFVA